MVYKAQNILYHKDECSKDHVNSIFIKIVIQAQKDHKSHFVVQIKNMKNHFFYYYLFKILIFMVYV